MEEEGKLSSQESGRDGDDETQDDLLAEVEARIFDRQAVEARIRSAALNRRTELGMPQSYAI